MKILLKKKKANRAYMVRKLRFFNENEIEYKLNKYKYY
jgi:hypothetical protein